MRSCRAAALSALSLLALTAGAQAATSPTVVTFSRWDAIVIHAGKQVVHSVPVGGTFRRCASVHLYALEAFFRVKGPSSGPDVERWYLNGKLRDGPFTDAQLSRKGSPYGTFEIFVKKGDTTSLATGAWKLTISYAGTQVGEASVAVAVNPHC
jgi:hypothetical protein